METKTKTIYAKWVAEGLLKLGFRPIDTYPNPMKLEFLCWEFADTDEFEVALSEVIATRQGGGRNG